MYWRESEAGFFDRGSFVSPSLEAEQQRLASEAEREKQRVTKLSS